VTTLLNTNDFLSEKEKLKEERKLQTKVGEKKT